MTIDKSLRAKKGIVRSRNVLTRAERIERLTQQDRWKEEDGVFGLSKVRVYKVVVKKKKKKKGEEEGTETTAASATATKAATSSKAAAPTKAAATKAAPAAKKK
ncbi:MAG: small basic protein [Planctomycetaceae bacterium]|jgi:small basic protein (TIGR04137 family)|nr:small basic protein [Planctomycetaceae bacterium]